MRREERRRKKKKKEEERRKKKKKKKEKIFEIVVNYLFYSATNATNAQCKQKHKADPNHILFRI